MTRCCPIVVLVAVLAGACGAPRAEPATSETKIPAAREARTEAERSALKREGRAAYGRKDWLSCAERLEQVDAWYEAGCCRALLGQADAAFVALQRAVDAGWHDASHLQADTDLLPLHTDARWPALVAATLVREDAYLQTVHAELARLYQEDQAERQGDDAAIDWEAVRRSDAARERRVEAILAAGEAKVADDYYHAAMIYQHGATPRQAARAHELATKAVALDPTNDGARWLVAASEDRRLMYEDRPQKYGTQFIFEDGTWKLWTFDPATTDAERMRWQVPPIAESLEKVRLMNLANKR